MCFYNIAASGAKLGLTTRDLPHTIGLVSTGMMEITGHLLQEESELCMWGRGWSWL